MYVNVWEEIRKAINKNGGDDYSDFNKDYCVIKFDSEDDVPLGCLVHIYSLTIVVRLVFEKDYGLYPQVYLDDCLYDV